ncbi:MAG TPA: tryptophan synthase subunit alpha [Bryobacterales bacterium]|nr:tryptophan synthase subunit alpha [Bryobacterales bacterium]
MTRIGRRFAALQQNDERGLVAYLTAGDPSLAQTPELAQALERGGADVIELGVPFSDPIADGPVIQAASERALRAGTTLEGVLDVVRKIRRRSEIPLVIFSYLNPILRYGFSRFAADAAAAGVDGALMTDLSVEEADPFVTEMRRHELDTIFLVAPTSTARRLELVARYSTGFVYLVSRTGVTGPRESLSDAVAPLVKRVRAVTSLPRAVGFGISRPEHMMELAPLAEAAAVGSAFMKLIGEYGASNDLAARLEQCTAQLKAGFRKIEV